VSPNHLLAKEYAKLDSDVDSLSDIKSLPIKSPAEHLLTVKHGQGRPHKATVTEEPHPRIASSFTVSTVLEIQQEPTIVKGKTPHGNKFKNSELKTMGPVVLTSEMQWTDFLDEIAKAIYTTQENLMVISFTWRWNTSSKAAAKLPLTNQAGFQTLVEQIQATKDVNTKIVVISMAQPHAPVTDLPVQLS